MVFTEITKTAIQNALKNIVPLDINLFQAQETRRIVDRLHGYKISPTQQKKKFKVLVRNMDVEAERVRSFTLNRIIKREREIKDYKYPPNKYIIEAKFLDKNEKNLRQILLNLKLNLKNL